MAKVRCDFRINSELMDYLKQKAKVESKTQTEIIETLLMQDAKKASSFTDDVADAIYKRFDDRIKSIRIAVNENNKLLKTQQKLLNFLLLAQEITMPYDYHQGAQHPAMIEAIGEVKSELKRLQVIKAEQRKNKINEARE